MRIQESEEASGETPDAARGTRALPKTTPLTQRYVKEPTFAKATVGRPTSAKTPARQALAHRARILADARVFFKFRKTSFGSDE